MIIIIILRWWHRLLGSRFDEDKSKEDADGDDPVATSTSSQWWVAVLYHRTWNSPWSLNTGGIDAFSYCLLCRICRGRKPCGPKQTAKGGYVARGGLPRMIVLWHRSYIDSCRNRKTTSVWVGSELLRKTQSNKIVVTMIGDKTLDGAGKATRPGRLVPR